MAKSTFGDFPTGRLSNYLFVFGLSACAICNGQPVRAHRGDFGDTFKALAVSRLNFVDTRFVPKTGLKGPQWTCKRAPVAMQPGPFWRVTVALSPIRRAERGNRREFLGSERPVFPSGW